MKTNFDDLYQLFAELDMAEASYLVLRGYEDLFDKQRFTGEHRDIDILCADAIAVRDAIGAIPNRRKEDFTHYHVFVGGERVNLDLRHLGDGYYCDSWEKQMLSGRRRWGCLYAMSAEDYFYSLAYHAVIQKKVLAEDYRVVLSDMAKDLSIPLKGVREADFISALEQYMRNQGFSYTYTADPSIPLRFSLVSSDMIVPDYRRRFRRGVFQVTHRIQTIGSKIKRLFSHESA
ncbi:MAG: hypothetical protein IJ764_05315 [Bacteroidales bacterium]|nr:hypothetical protein [Bacteroidales bacterium]